jgi:hypothetical protein
MNSVIDQFCSTIPSMVIDPAACILVGILLDFGKED